MISPTSSISRAATDGTYGLGAFNVYNLEGVCAVVAAAETNRSPAILQIHPSALKPGGARSRQNSAGSPARSRHAVLSPEREQIPRLSVSEMSTVVIADHHSLISIASLPFEPQYLYHWCPHGASGLGESLVRRSIELGICKFNLSTEVRQAYLDALREGLGWSRTDLLDLMERAIDAMKDVVSARLQHFGAVDKA